MKKFIKKIPIVGEVLTAIKMRIMGAKSFESAQYWEGRYSVGGNSGSGSYGRLALFKAEIINKFVIDEKIKSVIEYGCGDGNQLSLAKYPSYIGLDVSPSAVEACRKKFVPDSSKSFLLYDASKIDSQFLNAELTLSLDVIYHLVEDKVFEMYMKHLFESAERFVIIYSSNADSEQKYHERTRNFTEWINRSMPGWLLMEEIVNRYPYDTHDPENTSQSNFYFYRKVN